MQGANVNSATSRLVSPATKISRMARYLGLRMQMRSMHRSLISALCIPYHDMMGTNVGLCELREQHISVPRPAVQRLEDLHDLRC